MNRVWLLALFIVVCTGCVSYPDQKPLLHPFNSEPVCVRVKATEISQLRFTDKHIEKPIDTSISFRGGIFDETLRKHGLETNCTPALGEYELIFKTAFLGNNSFQKGWALLSFFTFAVIPYKERGVDTVTVRKNGVEISSKVFEYDRWGSIIYIFKPNYRAQYIRTRGTDDLLLILMVEAAAEAIREDLKAVQ